MLFSQSNDISAVKAVLTDKDCKEIVAINEVFTHSRALLCIFHVMQAINRRLAIVWRRICAVKCYKDFELLYTQAVKLL